MPVHSHVITSICPFSKKSVQALHKTPCSHARLHTGFPCIAAPARCSASAGTSNAATRGASHTISVCACHSLPCSVCVHLCTPRKPRLATHHQLKRISTRAPTTPTPIPQKSLTTNKHTHSCPAHCRAQHDTAPHVYTHLHVVLRQSAYAAPRLPHHLRALAATRCLVLSVCTCARHACLAPPYCQVIGTRTNQPHTHHTNH